MSALLEDMRMLIERGGYVMIPLLVLSVISLALVLERAAYWLMLHRPARLDRLAQMNTALRKGRRDTANQIASRDGSPYAAVARSLLKHGATDAVAIEAVQRQRPRLERFMVPLSTIITAAPLLGILGTVIGIIQSFKLLGAEMVMNDPSDVATGIAAALLTTALGLIVALFTLFPYMIYRGQVERALGRMESVIASAQQGAADNAPDS